MLWLYQVLWTGIDFTCFDMGWTLFNLYCPLCSYQEELGWLARYMVCLKNVVRGAEIFHMYVHTFYFWWVRQLKMRKESASTQELPGPLWPLVGGWRVRIAILRKGSSKSLGDGARGRQGLQSGAKTLKSTIQSINFFLRNLSLSTEDELQFWGIPWHPQRSLTGSRNLFGIKGRIAFS